MKLIHMKNYTSASPTRSGVRSGDKLRFGSSEYIIAEYASRELILINTKTGCRWSSSVTTPRGSYGGALTLGQIKILLGSVPIENVELVE